MRLWFERGHWGDVLMFGVEIYWEDWHLKEFHIALHLGKQILETHFKLGEADNDQH